MYEKSSLGEERLDCSSVYVLNERRGQSALRSFGCKSEDTSNPN